MFYRRRLASLFVVLCTIPLGFIAQSARTQTGSAPAMAKEKAHPIDAFYDACLEKHSSTVGTANCANEAEDRWDKQMNKDYQALLKSSNAKIQTKLRDSQRAWLVFRDKETMAEDAFCSRQGTKWKVVYAEAHMRLVKARALQLAAYLSENESD